jgi:hypothetical protein
VVLVSWLSLLVSLISYGGDVPIERDFLRLPDQRWIWLEKTGWHTTRITLGRGKKSFKNRIWSEVHETDGERHSWAYAYFVRIKPKQFITYDVDKNPQVAVSTYDLGNGVIRWAIVYRVKRDRLEVADEVSGYNVAADESVYN